MITDWKNKKVAILGLGVEGLSSFRFLHKKGAELSVLDAQEKSALDPKIVSEIEKAGGKFVGGDTYLSSLSEFEVIIRSPGIKRNLPELVAAEKAGVVIASQVKLFFDLCPAKIIGITGTKGKGTTSSLLYEMLKAADREVFLGGNIGVAPLDFLDKLTKTSWVVLELSSFQLEDLEKSPHIAVMLMTTSEHLTAWGNANYHETVEDYVSAKRHILRFQTPKDFAILNRDYPASNESDIYTEGKAFYVSRERETDNGCFVSHGKVIVRKNGNDEEIIHISDILLPGKHNLENVCAAVMAAKLAGAKKEAIVTVLKTFKGLEHRLERVAEVNGVTYYNDSFSTTPETAIAAIEAFESPEILILGGSSKKSDFSQLGIILRDASNIKAVIGIGEEWSRIKENFPVEQASFLLVEGAQTMQQIVQAAEKIAKPGDVVLLSPACASFDMFKNYKDRGEQFKKAVQTILQSNFVKN